MAGAVLQPQLFPRSRGARKPIRYTRARRLVGSSTRRATQPAAPQGRRPALVAASGGVDDWAAPPQRSLNWSIDSEDSDDDSDVDLFPEEGRDPEFLVQNVLALVLIALIALSAGNILLKLVIVAYSLISAAVRYTVIGIVLAMLLTAFQPGRWWF